MTKCPVGEGEANAEDTRLLEIFKSLVIPLGCSFPSSSEVVLHDLHQLPNSIIAIYGDVTGRSEGDPATDWLLRSFASEDFRTVVGYETTLNDGRRLKSSTMILNNLSGSPIAALCINSDVSVWHKVQEIADSMTSNSLLFADVSERSRPSSTGTGATVPYPEDGEAFVHDVDELAQHLIVQAVGVAGIPVDLMKKSHKIEVVRSLKASGMFLLRDAVEMIAEALTVSRFTIYNYLQEIEGKEKISETPLQSRHARAHGSDNV